MRLFRTGRRVTKIGKMGNFHHPFSELHGSAGGWGNLVGGGGLKKHIFLNQSIFSATQTRRFVEAFQFG